MAKKTVNSDIYNLSQLVDDVKSVFLPNETDETLSIGTYGYIGALESSRLQTQVQMTGELCNESFPSRARLERNIITHAIMSNIEDINAKPSKMSVFLFIRENDIIDYFDSTNNFVIDRECPIYIGDYEFHLEYDVNLKRIKIKKDNVDTYTYTAFYIIPSNRDVPTSTINYTNQYLSPPVVMQMANTEGKADSYIMLTLTLSQVQHNVVSKKLVTSNIIDNKTMNFEFTDQLAYFEVHVAESTENYYITPVFEGSAVPNNNAQYYCWYQYIDTDLIRIRFDRKSYMPGLNANIECLIKTTKGDAGNFKYGEDIYVNLESSTYGYKGITALLTPISDASGGKDRKSKKELQALIPKEALSRGSLTTITDLNNYFSMLDSESGRIVIQKKADNQIERVYYSYFVSKDSSGNVIPSNTIDICVPIDAFVYSKPSDSDSPRYLLKSGACFRLGDDGIGYLNDMPLLGKGYKFTPKAVTRGNVVESTFTVEVNSEGEDKDAVSVAVDVGGSQTPTHIFPKEEKDRLACIDSSEEILVEDYLQMGTGKIYNYQIDYIVQEDNSEISVRDKILECLDFVEASYTVNGSTRAFDTLPILAYNIEKGTKISFNIKRRFNEKGKGIITFSYNGNEYKLNQKMEADSLSAILATLGITVGEVTNAVSSDSSIIKLTETGTIEGNSVSDNEPNPTVNPYTLKTVKESELPAVKERKENEWFYVVNDETADTASTTTEEPYKLNVDKTSDLPDVEDREENNWFYGVNKATDDSGKEIDPVIVHSDKDYKLSVALSSEMPPVEERQENEWFYNITGSSVKAEIPDDPDQPVVPTELTGKEYSVKALKNFSTPVTITVTVQGVDYVINVSQNRFLLENALFITEAGVQTHRVSYTTYMPTLDQDVWPDELVRGNRVTYTLRYLSLSNTYIPDITIKLSEGLDYVAFSNKITYPDGSTIAYEPAEVSIADERGFLYTNPFAANVNAYKLYSAFYMMSMEENPYNKFTFINNNSNIQFISTNTFWTRPFLGPDKDKYTISINITQSVQADLGLDPNPEDPYAPPLVKAIAVFKRDGKAYRYRSLKFDPASSDKGSLSFTFTRDFDSSDKFDNSNNIEITGMQVAGQNEYSVALGYDDKTYTLNNGGVKKFYEKDEKGEEIGLLKQLGITISGTISEVTSSSYDLGVYPIYGDDGVTIVNYSVVSYTDFDDEETITIKTSGNVEYTITANSTNPTETEYGYFNPTTQVSIYVYCGIPDILGVYSKDTGESVCPGLDKWTLTNIYEVVNGVTMYHNYSEIMGSRVIPYGTNLISEGPRLLNLEGFYIKGVPMFGYDYCQNSILVQSAINSLNYRRAYIDSAVEVLENSFGMDFKLFNTYGPSKTYYIIKDTNANNVLDDSIEFIDKVNLTLYFRIKLVANNDSYTKSNIIDEIKSYIEDLDDLGELHIPNLVTQITTNYKEQVQYFEYLGFNDYGPGVQHIYKLDDSEIPIHDAPEFLNVNNTIGSNGDLTPDINIYVSEI